MVLKRKKSGIRNESLNHIDLDCCCCSMLHIGQKSSKSKVELNFFPHVKHYHYCVCMYVYFIRSIFFAFLPFFIFFFALSFLSVHVLYRSQFLGVHTIVLSFLTVECAISEALSFYVISRVCLHFYFMTRDHEDWRWRGSWWWWWEFSFKKFFYNNNNSLEKRIRTKKKCIYVVPHAILQFFSCTKKRRKECW